MFSGCLVEMSERKYNCNLLKSDGWLALQCHDDVNWIYANNWMFI